MEKTLLFLLSSACIILCLSSKKANESENREFPDELVHFVPYKNNPVFAGTGNSTWDNQIS